MLSALAIMKTQRRRSRSMAAPPVTVWGLRRPEPGGTAQFHSGIQARPRTPVTTKAARQPLLHGDPGGEHGRDDLPEADAGLIDGVAEGAFAGQQVLVDRLSGGRNAGGFGDAEHRAAADQSAEAARETGGDSGAGPQSDGEADDAVQAQGDRSACRRTARWRRR